MENNEWLYSEYLKRMKEKEKQREDAVTPIELELPMPMEQETDIDGKLDSKQAKEERGVVIIELL